MNRSLQVEQALVVMPFQDVAWTEVWESVECLKSSGPWTLGDWEDTQLGQICLLC